MVIDENLSRKQRADKLGRFRSGDNIRKKKQLLSETLKAFFRIDEDPFYPYKEEKAYRAKFTLKAEGD